MRRTVGPEPFEDAQPKKRQVKPASGKWTEPPFKHIAKLVTQIAGHMAACSQRFRERAQKLFRGVRIISAQDRNRRLVDARAHLGIVENEAGGTVHRQKRPFIRWLVEQNAT